MRNKNVLVTGATGFIGFNLVLELIKRKNKVTCLAFPTDNISRLKNLGVRVFKGDICRKERLRAVLSKPLKKTDYVFHLAAVLGKLQVNNPEDFYKVNFEGTKNLVEICMAHARKLKRFVYSSSIAVVGPSSPTETLNEKSPCHPVSEYGKSKLMAELYLNSLKQEFPFTILRFPLVYGPHSNKGLYFIFKLVSKRIQPTFIQSQTNVCYIQDLVTGMLMSAENSKSRGQTYLLGENRIYTTDDIVESISEALNKDPIKINIPIPVLCVMASLFEFIARIMDSKPLMTRDSIKSYLQYRHWRFDTAKATRDFGFKPQVSLKEGSKITARWYMTHGYI